MKNSQGNLVKTILLCQCSGEIKIKFLVAAAIRVIKPAFAPLCIVKTYILKEISFSKQWYIFHAWHFFIKIKLLAFWQIYSYYLIDLYAYTSSQKKKNRWKDEKNFSLNYQFKNVYNERNLWIFFHYFSFLHYNHNLNFQIFPDWCIIFKKSNKSFHLCLMSNFPNNIFLFQK